MRNYQPPNIIELGTVQDLVLGGMMGDADNATDGSLLPIGFDEQDE